MLSALGHLCEGFVLPGTTSLKLPGSLEGFPSLDPMSLSRSLSRGSEDEEAFPPKVFLQTATIAGPTLSPGL